MKVRQGFISNSSSSSFIIKNKNNFNKAIDMLKSDGYDYYIFKDTLYTSFVSDCSPIYSYISYLSDEDESGDYTPYEEEDYIELEGEAGIASVWIAKDRLTDEDFIQLHHVPASLAQELYNYVLLQKRDYEDGKEINPEDFRAKCFKLVVDYEEEE